MRYFLSTISILGCVLSMLIILPISSVSAQNAPSAPPMLIVNSPTLLPFQNPEKYPGVNFREVEKIVKSNKGSEGIVAFIKYLFNNVKQLLGPILVFLIVGVGVQLVISQGEEEAFNAAMRNFKYILAGTAIVIFSEKLAELFSLYQSGGTSTFLSTPQAMGAAQTEFKKYFTIIITFIRYLLGGIAVFYVVKSGLAIIISADEETVTKQKDVFLYGFAGFIIIMAADALVKVVFDLDSSERAKPSIDRFYWGPELNISGGIGLLTNVTNMLLGATAGLFLFTLVVGGAMYTFSAGNEERGKKGLNIIIGSVIGLVIAFASYTIVTEFSTRNVGRGREVQEVQEDKVPLELNVPKKLPPAKLY